MRGIIVPFLVLLCICLAAVFVVLNTPLVTNVLLSDLINNHVSTFEIESFHCKAQKSQLPDLLVFKGASFQIRKGARVFDVKADEIAIYNFFEFLQKHELLRISTRGLYFNSKEVQAKAVQLKAVVGLDGRDMTFVEGAGFSQELIAGPYAFSKMTAHIKANPKKIKVFNIKGNFYGGEVKGQLNFDYKPEFSYEVWSEFANVSTESVASPYGNFFKLLDGTISGSLRVVGGSQVDIFTVILRGDKGLSIAPGVFLMMREAFDEEEIAALQKLRDDQAVLVAKKAILHVQNSRDSDILLVFDIEEAKEGLILEGKYPFSWHGGFQSFLFPIKQP